MKALMVSAPAKINWTLDITGTDDRGYHLLDMLMQRISLYDVVTVSRAPTLTLTSSERWLATDERNTAYKAAKLFLEAADLHEGAALSLRKNIPSGAGLAGGSADAAAALFGLNRLFGGIFSPQELDALALKVGSDVPFMLRDHPCRVSGTGEKTEDLGVLKPQSLLLVMNRRQPAPTKLVYKRFDEVGSAQKPDTDAFLACLRAGDAAGLAGVHGNALTEAAITVAPDIGDNLNRLKDSGALCAAMTGSGSVCFGVYPNGTEAAKAGRLFSDRWHFCCETINYGLRARELNEGGSL